MSMTAILIDLGVVICLVREGCGGVCLREVYESFFFLVEVGIVEKL